MSKKQAIFFKKERFEIFPLLVYKDPKFSLKEFTKDGTCNSRRLFKESGRSF